MFDSSSLICNIILKFKSKTLYQIKIHICENIYKYYIYILLKTCFRLKYIILNQYYIQIYIYKKWQREFFFVLLFIYIWALYFDLLVSTVSIS